MRFTTNTTQVIGLFNFLLENNIKVNHDNQTRKMVNDFLVMEVKK